ncbi:PulJ/GspJ family protein [Acaryochloris marina]|uniref:Prepilin-type N-cleavage/methylation domain protein n=1 Tax=Acaryochloris marina (strain MBIC 11017) TaxID=329726 RepID=B0C0H5_ACAM1|nr:prepilin-type N-terminal cleavage/methylation domain-containing protein [Acaryochloris marina]ABW30768.1 prepilin-type N- cleavage/methylation domain protein [Acaryochloris marina MBIC11017]
MNQQPDNQTSTLHHGYTLVELLIATIITSLVVSIAGYGVIAATQANKRTEAIAARRHDLSRAFDFISNEIRMAHRINQSQLTKATNPSSMSSLLTSAGLNASDWTTPVLYLEIPITTQVPEVCPTGGPNAGSPPPQPAAYDQVVYDIRPSTQDWLAPNSIYRYGRVPRSDGSIDPCSDPVASDTLVDAIAMNVDTTPDCPTPGVLMGTGGFQACVNGNQVDLFMRSRISEFEIHRLSSTATSRSGNSQPIPVLTAVQQPGTNNVDLNWQWSGSTNGVTFEVKKEITTTAQKSKIKTGADSSQSFEMQGSPGDQHCYSVTAKVGQITSPESNKACFTQIANPIN